jgi:ribonuclease VapC
VTGTAVVVDTSAAVAILTGEADGDAETEVIDVDAEAAERELGGWRRFGKGRHPAGLNFGDCIADGVAAELDLPVLCVGDDFRRTDITAVCPPS